MAFIRRVRTASGATAVQIAAYRAGRQEIVKHVGSAHTDAELGVLMERARELLGDPAQGVLDLGIEPTPRVLPLAEAPSGQGVLPAVPAPPARRPAAARDSGGRVLATGSRVLYDALLGVVTGLGFTAATDEVFCDLVIARIVEPTSLLDAGRVLTDLGRRPASYPTMNRTLRKAVKGDYRDRIAAACFARASTAGDLTLCLYDVTTLYFEAEHEDDLRKVGYSKERRVDPQVVVGLLVDRQGFPLEIGCFEGNKAETHTLIPIITQFTERHGLADLAVTADAGMLSAANLKALDEAHVRFIVGSRVTRAPADLESHFHWHGDAFTDGQVIDTITPKTGRAKGGKVGENDTARRAEPVWDPTQHTQSWRAVWAYSAKRAARDRKTLALQEARAREVVDGERAARTPRFVKTSNGARSLDEKALARAQSLAGLKGYVTNIPAAVMPAAEVIGSYHDLWRVEQSFRMSKTDLRARPMFHHTRDAIEAHLTVVFTALAVAREVQNRTGLAIGNVIRQLRPLRSATVAINGATQTFHPAVPAAQQAILEALPQVQVTH